jgi:hypothetical protein
MKTPVIYPCLLLLTIALTSCKKTFPDDPLAISGLSVSDCKTKGEPSKGFDSEYITLKTVDDFYLQFNHVNSIFNCLPGQITISLSISADKITINEEESESSANCICPYDVEFKLGPLKAGVYLINFQKSGSTFKEYSLDFKKSTNIRIDI